MLKLTLNPYDIAKAAVMVIEGGLIIYPTDTVYGLGCDPYLEKAVKRVLLVKSRGMNPLPVLFSSSEEALKVVDLGELGLMLAEKFWPGPLTLVCNLKAGEEQPAASLGSGTLGVRVPNHDACLDLIATCGGRLVGTSANRTGERALSSHEELDSRLTDLVDAVVEGGRTPLQVESTVVRVSGNKCVLIREGYVKKSELKKFLGGRLG